MKLHCLHMMCKNEVSDQILHYLHESGVVLYDFFIEEELIEFAELSDSTTTLIIEFEPRVPLDELSKKQIRFIENEVLYDFVTIYYHNKSEAIADRGIVKFLRILHEFQYRNTQYDVELWHYENHIHAINWMISQLLMSGNFESTKDQKLLLGILNHRFREKPLSSVISFSPEHKQAGIQILSYFQEILNQKYPDVEASVKISQNGSMVTMEVETADGQKELIEKTFEEYQLVISGKKPPEEFLDNKLQIAALENEVRIAVMRVENAQNLLQVQSDQIDELKHDKRSMQLQLVAALNSNQSLQKQLSKLVKAVVKNNNVEHVFRMLELQVGAEPTEVQMAEIKKELEALKKKEPKAFKDFVKNVTAGVVTNVTSPWFIQLVGSIPV